MRASEEQPQGWGAPEASSVVLSALRAAAGTLDPSSAPSLPPLQSRTKPSHSRSCDIEPLMR